MKPVTAAAAALILVTAMPVAAETATVPADNLFPFLAKYYALAPTQRDHFEMAFFLMVKGDRHAVSASFKAPGGDVPLTVAPDGRMSPVPSAADLNAKRQMTLAAPKGTQIGITIQLMPAIHPAARLDAGYLATAIAQAHDGAKKAAGIMSLAVPDYRTICFRGSHAGTVTLRSGKTVALTVQKNPQTQMQAPCFTPSETPDAVQVALDTAPSDMIIVPKPN